MFSFYVPYSCNNGSERVVVMINNCFNYVGSKDRILNIIDRNLDKSKKYFIDVFCGSGVVGVNETTNYDKIVLNDKCWQLIETLKYFKNNSYSDILSEIDEVIDRFKLSKENKEGFISLREFYNENHKEKENFNPILFYCLVTHSFNYLIGINKSGGFNVSFGSKKSSFNSSLRKKFELFQNTLYTFKDKITFKSLDFKELIESSKGIMKNSVYYIDPPYLSSDDSYSRVQYTKWDPTKEQSLYKTIDEIHENGGSFLLSNVIENNGVINTVLDEWSKKYEVIEVTLDYSNCNYQRKNLGKTKEVLIKNY